MDSASPAARGWLAQGALRNADADPDGAIRLYREAVQQAPADVPAHLRYVAGLLALGRRTHARAEYQARAASPDATDAERTMSERLSTNGSSSALRRVYTNAASRAPESPWWLLALAEVEIAEADAWNHQRLEAQRRGDQSIERKADAQARGALARAETALARAEPRAPDLAELAMYRGFFHATRGDVEGSAKARDAAYQDAATALHRATQLDPDLVEAWAALGDVRLRAGDERGSLLALREAVRRAPADGDYRESLGVALHDADRPLDAARQYEQAARLKPWDPNPLVRLGDAHADAEAWEAALSAYAEALERDPDTVEAHLKTGLVLEHLGRRAAARAAYQRYVRADGPKASSVERRIDRLLEEDTR